MRRLGVWRWVIVNFAVAAFWIGLMLIVGNTFMAVGGLVFAMAVFLFLALPFALEERERKPEATPEAEVTPAEEPPLPEALPDRASPPVSAATDLPPSRSGHMRSES